MFCCIEHVEEAMDRFIDEQESVPEIFTLEYEHHCDFCENPAAYRVVAGAKIHEDVNEGEI